MFKLISAFIGKESAKMEKASNALKYVTYGFLFLALVCAFNILESAGFFAYVGLILFSLFAWQIFSFRKKLNFAISIGRKAAALADSADAVQTLGKEVYKDFQNGELNMAKLDDIAYRSEDIIAGVKQVGIDMDNSDVKL